MNLEDRIDSFKADLCLLSDYQNIPENEVSEKDLIEFNKSNKFILKYIDFESMKELAQGSTKEAVNKLSQEIVLQRAKNSGKGDEFTPALFCNCELLGLKKVSKIKPLLERMVKEGKLQRGLRKDTYTLPHELEEIQDEQLPEEEQEEVYTQEYREALEKEIKKYKRFVVTTAVMGKEVNKPFLDSVKNYARRNKALMLVLPCEDVSSRGKKAAPIELSSDLKDFRVVFKDTYLNKNLCLCAIKVSAKQINPLTGLDRLPINRQASIIVASPKVFLKYIPNMHYDIPPALMTTGAITVNDYDNDRYMSKRTSTLAENDHTYGVVLIEIENENIFHFRHAQASEEGTLTDLGVEYLPDGSIKKMKDTVMVMGDTHIGYHDKELHEEVMKLAKKVNVNKTVLHDIFNGTSITHHDLGKNVTRAIKAEDNKLGLEDECIAVKNYLEDIENRGMEVYIPEANHHTHLTKYLERGGYVTDPINHKFSLKLAVATLEGMNPLKYAIESLLGFKRKDVHWLEVDKSCKFYGVECAVHGDLGANGSRGNARIYNNGIGNCVTAHTHSASILRDTYCVGTVGLMDMGYNKGMSSWTRTCCLIYSNGTKQLVNFIPDKDGYYSCSL